jgi:hypothetical protein
MPCSLVDVYQCFGRTWRWNIRRGKNEQSAGSLRDTISVLSLLLSILPMKADRSGPLFPYFVLPDLPAQLTGPLIAVISPICLEKHPFQGPHVFPVLLSLIGFLRAAIS